MIPCCLSNTNLTNVSKLSETMENVLKVLRSFGKPMLRPCPYYTPEEFDNGGFTLRTQQMFSVHTTPEEFKNATITRHFGFTRSGKSHDYRDAIVFQNAPFPKCFPSTRKQEASVFKFLRFDLAFSKSFVFVTD